MNAPVIRTGLAAAAMAALLAGCPSPPAVTNPSVTDPTATAPSLVPTTPSADRGSVTDAVTGVRAELPGPVTQETETVLPPAVEEVGVAYHALEPSGRVEAVLHIAPVPTEQRLDPQEVAETTAHLVVGELTGSQPLVVEGYPAVDARITGWHRAGGSGSGTLLLRIIDTPGFEVIVEANGDSTDEALIQQIFDQVCASLRIP